jgi:hypothetical protein
VQKSISIFLCVQGAAERPHTPSSAQWKVQGGGAGEP